MTTVDVDIKNPKIKVPRVPTPAFRVTEDANGDKHVQDMAKDLVDCLRDVMRTDGLYDKNPHVSVIHLFDELSELRNMRDSLGNRKLKQLVKYLEKEYADTLERVKAMVNKGMVTFSALKLLFGEGTHVVIPGEHPLGGKVTDVCYHASMWGTYLTLDVEYITSNGVEFMSATREVYIPGYSGVQALKDLPVQLVNDQVRQQLHDRGVWYSKIALGAHYLHLTGAMGVQKWYNVTPMRATGRCMVDIQTHDQFNESRARRNQRQRNVSLAPELMWMTDSHVHGFSFVTKQWGSFPVGALSEIQFRSNAYDQLVLDAKKKSMIRALVQHSEGSFDDIIAGKGGGCIFLLHGEPGVGKTLTAEAVSELLKRPLYSVSVGELGTDPASLEKQLRQILDVAQIWNAVILLDEADIFLECRSTGDILRNGMISIFLKLLEYHQGVMFLTTNRVNDFDPAFYSRISVALRYDALDREARAQVWRNLLDAAGVTHVDEHTLSVHDLNGRQIKNVVRISNILAKEQGLPISVELIETCIAMSSEFLHA